MGRRDSALLDLVRLAYAAPTSSDGWTRFHDRYRTVMEGNCVSFVLHDRGTGRSTAKVVTGPAASEAMRQYNAYFGARNPLLSRGERLLRPGAVTLSQVLNPPETFFHTEYYNDFARPFELACGIGVWLLEYGGVAANISCNRSLRAGWYGTEDVAFLECLVPHLQRAFQIHQVLGALRFDHRTEADALDHLGSGVLVVSGDGRVLLANACARRILATGDGLSIVGDGLRASRPAETKALRALIAAASACARGQRLHSGGALQLLRPSLRAPLRVVVAPAAPPLAYPALPAGAVTVLVRDPDEGSGEGGLLRSLYGLTVKEAELARALLGGLSLEESCEELAIARETARTHLRGILRKTGTRRQSEFVRLATTGLAGQTRGFTRSSEPVNKSRTSDRMVQ